MSNAGITNAARFSVFTNKSGVDFPMRTLSAGANVVITNEGTNLVIASTATGGTNAYNPNQFSVANGTNVSVKSGAVVTNLESRTSFTSDDITSLGPVTAGTLVDAPQGQFYLSVETAAGYATNSISIGSNGVAGSQSTGTLIVGAGSPAVILNGHHNTASTAPSINMQRHRIISGNPSNVLGGDTLGDIEIFGRNSTNQGTQYSSVFRLASFAAEDFTNTGPRTRTEFRVNKHGATGTETPIILAGARLTNNVAVVLNSNVVVSAVAVSSLLATTGGGDLTNATIGSNLTWDGATLSASGTGAGGATIVTNMLNGGRIDATPVATLTNVLFTNIVTVSTNLLVTNAPLGIPIRTLVYANPGTSVSLPQFAAANYIGGKVVSVATGAWTRIEIIRQTTGVTNVMVSPSDLDVVWVWGPTPGVSTNYVTGTAYVTNVVGLTVATNGTAVLSGVTNINWTTGVTGYVSGASAFLGVNVSGGGGSTNLATENWYNVLDYGATVNDGTDDTWAISNAIYTAVGGSKTNRAVHATIYFPSGEYHIGGAIIPGSSNENAQIIIPLKNNVTVSDFGQYSVLRFLGASPATWDHGSTPGGNHSTNGSILSATITNEGWMFRSAIPTGGSFNHNQHQVYWQNLTFQYHSNSGNHLSIIDAENFLNANVIDCAIRSRTPHTALTVSPRTNTVGLNMPKQAMGHDMILRNVVVSGFGTGIRAGEHITANNVTVTGNRVGIEFKQNTHPNYWDHIVATGCSNVLFGSASSIQHISALAIERLNTGDWRSNQWDFVDLGGVNGVIWYNILDDVNPVNNNRIRRSGFSTCNLRQLSDPLQNVSMSTGNMHLRGPSVRRYTADGTPGAFTVLKSRGGEASPAVANSGDLTGIYGFGGWDGDEWVTSSYIGGVFTATPANNNVPVRLDFAIGNNNSGATNIFHVTGSGVGAFTNAPQARLHVLGSGAIGFTDQNTNATTGFLYLPTMTNAPLAAPTAIGGYTPMLVDTNAARIWVYVNGAWKYVVLN